MKRERERQTDRQTCRQKKNYFQSSDLDCILLDWKSSVLVLIGR